MTSSPSPAASPRRPLRAARLAAVLVGVVWACLAGGLALAAPAAATPTIPPASTSRSRIPAYRQRRE